MSIRSKTSSIVFVVLAILLATLTSVSTLAQQPSIQLSPEDAAFGAVSAATNPAARLAAAEDFVSNFPQSHKRPEVARLVSEQLKVLRNAQIAVSIVDRARTIFVSSEELEFLKPAALEIYADADRPDQAFALAADLLSGKPTEFPLLAKLTYLGAREARNRNLKYIDSSVTYGLRAIEIIEKEERPAGMSDSVWTDQTLKVPGLYQQLGIIQLGAGRTAVAKAQILKSIQLDPKDPSSYALLGRVLNGEYETLTASYQKLPGGNSKQDEKIRLDNMLDEIIDTYAHAIGLATGKVEHQTLLQQLVPDLTAFYKYRHNESTAGLQKLINKYRH